MALNWVEVAGWVFLAAVLGYFIWKFYSTRADFTYMTHNDQGFRRALKGRGFIWHPEEFVVRGPGAPRIEFVALDPASGQRRMTPLLNARTGAINLRPQYCAPLPFLVAWARRFIHEGSFDIRWKNLWKADLSGYDLVYAYLSPAPMPRLWEKAIREMRSGSLLVSFQFGIPGLPPDQIFDAGGKLLFVWRMP